MLSMSPQWLGKTLKTAVQHSTRLSIPLFWHNIVMHSMLHLMRVDWICHVILDLHVIKGNLIYSKILYINEHL